MKEMFLRFAELLGLFGRRAQYTQYFVPVIVEDEDEEGRKLWTEVKDGKITTYFTVRSLSK